MIQNLYDQIRAPLPIPDCDDMCVVRHVDPCGRLNIGRRHAHKTYATHFCTDGSLYLVPVAIVDKRKLFIHRCDLEHGNPTEVPKEIFHVAPYR